MSLAAYASESNEQTEILYSTELIAKYHQYENMMFHLAGDVNLRTEANQDVTSNFK